MASVEYSVFPSLYSHTDHRRHAGEARISVVAFEELVHLREIRLNPDRVGLLVGLSSPRAEPVKPTLEQA